jgi:hypothetical protein
MGGIDFFPVSGEEAWGQKIRGRRKVIPQRV